MAGIYLHIPFCKKACHYCDFHFSTSPVYKDQMVRALRNELILRKGYTNSEQIETIYFGGGTPSVLSADELGMLIHEITEHYPVSASAEITLEANPDDLSPQKVKELRQIPVNRFSIGIQSFFEEDLKWMNRAHNAAEAHSSIKRVQDAGFENITADLIYGYPLLANEKWEYNIRQLIELQIPHISSYSMTVEPATALAAYIKKGVQKPMNEAQGAHQFEMLMDELAGAGFEHYEISNFSKPGWHSKHNSNYWEGISYIGIGPSAHSFNGESRQWNVSDNMKYIAALEGNKIPFEIEHLSMENRINEYIMTALRTSKGMDLDIISQRYHSDYNSQILENLEPFLEKEWVIKNDQKVTLSNEGKLFADHIASELFVELTS
jgi:oxygen-independent coproporphyrinogen-3 oxidase